jgi:hypothetical protein
VGVGEGLGVDILMAMGGFKGVMFVVCCWKFCGVRLCNGRREVDEADFLKARRTKHVTTMK